MIGEVQLVSVSSEFVGLTVVPPAVVQSAEDGEGLSAVLEGKSSFGIEVMIEDVILWSH